MSSLSPLFTDLYQLSMAVAYLRSQKHNEPAVFELFFRECPFGGEYAVFSGHEAARQFLQNFRFSEKDLAFLKAHPSFQDCPPEIFDELGRMDLEGVEIDALPEGELAFARVPLVQARGPLWKLQLLESGLLNAFNFATLVSTYARRIRLVSGGRRLIEFGLRRAQGPNGAMTASRSSFVGGFDGSSNVKAGFDYGIPTYGTMAHSFVQSFQAEDVYKIQWDGQDIQNEWQSLQKEDGAHTNLGELASFIQYAQSFPKTCLLLVDTYDTLKSGLPNAIRVLKMLRARGHEGLGIRLDSGDLVYLSQQARKMLNAAGFTSAQIFASNELNEEVIDSLIDQGAKIDAFGVGTHLVTCHQQPALGGVYKLVELKGQPRLKLSQQTAKLVIPGAKTPYRLFGKEGRMLLDYLCLSSEAAPQPNEALMALHPTDPFRRVSVTPTEVRPLLQPFFRNTEFKGETDLFKIRDFSLERMSLLREDHTRRNNPTPYKVSVSPKLRSEFERLYEKEAPPRQLS